MHSRITHKHTMKQSAVLFLFLAIVLQQSSAQSVYLHPSHEVYDFFKRMEGKHTLTDYRDAVKPITRQDVARYLMVVDEHADQLTAVESEQLRFYKQEFYLELKQLNYEKDLPEERWHLFPYRSAPGRFNVDLVGGYSVQANAAKTNTKIRSNGLFAYGYAGDFLGMYLYFRDNQESGTYHDPRKDLTPIQGQIVSKSQEGAIQYDLADAQMNFDIAFLKVSLEKMPNVWGAGYRGTLILSDKPPSYPQIKLRARLGKDVDFTFMHSWLSSDVVDSVNSYYAVGVPKTLGYRTIYRQKYLAAQMLEASVANGVDIAVGESEVYGGRNPELLYLIPGMFYFAAEHYTGDEDNKQLFGSVDINALRNYNFYMTLFLDEFSVSEFTLTDRQRNQLGFTLGARSYDLIYPNTDILVEYTRINPWVYNHKFPDATYQSHLYDLGHWIGQNADNLYLEANYRPFRNLRLGVQFESMRKGAMDSTKFQYQLPTPTFLYAPMIKTQSFGLTARYEPVRDLFFDFHFLFARYTQQPDVRGKFQYARISNVDYADRIDAFLAVRYNFY